MITLFSLQELEVNLTPNILLAHIRTPHEHVWLLAMGIVAKKNTYVASVHCKA